MAPPAGPWLSPPATVVANTRHPFASRETVANGLKTSWLEPPAHHASVGTPRTRCCSPAQPAPHPEAHVWNHHRSQARHPQPQRGSLMAATTAGIPPHPGCPARRIHYWNIPPVLAIPHDWHTHSASNAASATTSWSRSTTAPGQPQGRPPPRQPELQVKTAAASRAPATIGILFQPYQLAFPDGSPDAAGYPAAKAETPAPHTLPSNDTRTALNIRAGIPCLSMYSLFFDSADRPAATTANSLCCTLPYNAAYAQRGIAHRTVNAFISRDAGLVRPRLREIDLQTNKPTDDDVSCYEPYCNGNRTPVRLTINQRH